MMPLDQRAKMVLLIQHLDCFWYLICRQDRLRISFGEGFLGQEEEILATSYLDVFFFFNFFFFIAVRISTRPDDEMPIL